MEIKEALLTYEIDKIKEFLLSNDLDYENNIQKSFYIEENNEICATISVYKNIIKCFAVASKYRNLNYGSILISNAINYFYENKIYHYMVYTKKVYANTFNSLGFKEIISTDNVSILEAGINSIDDYIKDLKRKIEYKFDIILEQSDLACLVVNCNPVTNGHLELIEYASKHHQYVIVFLLEEDLSLFTYKERMTLLYLAVNHLSNVLVVPSSCYIISSLTFPNYFLKNEQLKNKQWAITDALIFNNYFMKYLNISKRYIGTETNKIMKEYNETLKEILVNKIVEVDRFKLNDEVISASLVRQYINSGDIEKASSFIPNASRMIFMQIAKQKYRDRNQ